MEVPHISNVGRLVHQSALEEKESVSYRMESSEGKHTICSMVKLTILKI